MAQAQRDVSRSARAMKGEVRDLQLTFKEMATFSVRNLRVLAGAFVVGGAARAVLNVADAYKSLTAQLKLATAQYGSFEQANKDVRAIAESTRSDLLSTAELYAALQRNADQLGASQQQVARTTETVSKAFKISGASTDEAANATRQLLQAFQSGRLQGDEFRSLMENAPRLTRLLADSLGTTIGNLRKLSKEGELTSDKLLQAFTDKRFTDELDKEFSRLPVTFEQAMGQVYNAAVVTFGAFDQGGQFSTALANFITQGTNGFAQLEQSAYQWGASFRGVLDGLDAAKEAYFSVGLAGRGAFNDANDAAITFHGTLSTILGVIDDVSNAFANLLNAPGNLVRLGLGQNPILNPFNSQGAFDSAYDKAQTDAARRKIMGRGAADVLAEFGLSRAVPAFRPTPTGGGGRTRRAPKDRSADVEAQFDAELRQADMEILRARQDLTKNAEERARIELQVLELERDSENAEIDEKVRRAKQDLADKRITETAYSKVVADAAILKAKNDEATRLKEQAIIDERRRQIEEDTFKLSDQDRQFKIDALHFADQMATTQAEHRRIQLQILDAEIEQRRLELEHEKQLAIRNGATRQEIDAIQARIDHLQTERAQGAAGVLRNTQGPLEDYFSQVPRTVDEANEAMQQLEVQGIDGVINALVEGRHGWGAFRDAAIQAIDDIIAQLIRMQLMKLAANIIGGASGVPGLGGGIGGGSGIIVNSGITPSAGSGLFGFANGGSFDVGGIPGIDRNVLSLNGLPIARVSYGERVNIANDNRSGAGSGGGNITVHAPITIQGNASRETLDQAAGILRRRVANVARTGLP